MSNWREIISKAPMNYETGEWEKTPSPYSGQGNSVKNTMSRRMKEAQAGEREKQIKNLQRMVEQQIESKLPQMAEMGQTRIRIPRDKLESQYDLYIGDSGEDYEMPANDFMQELNRLLGEGLDVGVEGKDVIIDTGRGNLATRDGKTLHPESGEPMGTMESMGQRVKDAVGRTRLGSAMGKKKFGRTTKAEEHLEIVSDAILKAKSVLQEAGHLGTIEMKEPLTGEEVTRKKPKKTPAEEKFDNPQIEGYGHVGDKHYIGKALMARYNGIAEQLVVVDNQIAKAYVDGATSSRQELLNKRIRIENSLDDVSKSILSKTILDSMYVLETIVKSTSNQTPVFVDTIAKTLGELEALMDKFNAGEIDRAEYERRYKNIKDSLHGEASSPGGHDSGDGKPRGPRDMKKFDIQKNLAMLDDLMERFKAGELTAEELEEEYRSDVRESLFDEASTGHDSVLGLGPVEDDDEPLGTVTEEEPLRPKQFDNN